MFTIHARSDGGSVAIDAVDIFRVGDDGKVSTFKAYWDAVRPE